MKMMVGMRSLGEQPCGVFPMKTMIFLILGTGRSLNLIRVDLIRDEFFSTRNLALPLR
jgi:hypothetical protein